jgi:hypothetical protein
MVNMHCMQQQFVTVNRVISCFLWPKYKNKGKKMSKGKEQDEIKFIKLNEKIYTYCD